MSKDSNMGSNLVFFLLGAATGAAIALLYAPQEGEATRRMLGDKASEYKDKASDVTSQVTQSVQKNLSVATDKMQDLLNRGQQTASDTMQKARDTVGSMSS